MELRETLQLSLESVLAHKVRSILTILGVVFGVAAVIAMLSIGEGARQETLEQISVMGVHNVIIRPLTAEKKAEKTTEESKVTNSLGLTSKDAQAIKDICPFVEEIEVNVEQKKTAFFGGEHVEVPVVGVTPTYSAIFSTKLREGRFISNADVDGIENFCVLGYDAKQKLLPFRKALGEHVKLGDQWFTVVGVADQKPLASKFGGPSDRNQNLDVYVPVSTARFKFGHERPRTKNGNVMVINGVMVGGGDDVLPGRENVDQITVKLSDAVGAGDAAQVIGRLLDRRHNGAEDYTVTVPEELLKQSQETQRIFNIVMIAIASISLVVGGIGIMNIMLASVMERTREIGVRRALGATERTVVAQFLSEAVILSMSGGIIGLLVGYSLTGAISAYAEWRTIISPISVVLSFSVSVATGVVFGYYPARTAARKNPIDALRYE